MWAAAAATAVFGEGTAAGAIAGAIAHVPRIPGFPDRSAAAVAGRRWWPPTYRMPAAAAAAGPRISRVPDGRAASRERAAAEHPSVATAIPDADRLSRSAPKLIHPLPLSLPAVALSVSFPVRAAFRVQHIERFTFVSWVALVAWLQG